MFGSIFFWPFASGLMAIGIIIELIIIAFVVWMVIDCVQRKFNNDAEKIVWVVVIILTTWIGSLLYYIIVRALNPRGLSKK